MKKHLVVVGIILLFILSSVSPLAFGNNIGSKEQSTIENYDRYLYPEFYDSYNVDELPSFVDNQNSDKLYDFEKVDEQGYNIMRKFDNNYKPQKMDASSGTSTICGYVTDEKTGLPVENAKIDIDDPDCFAYTDSTGFYIKSTPPNYSVRLNAHGNGYLSSYHCCYVLYENKTIWANLSLRPRLPETSIIYGYITDEITGEPVEDAKIRIKWRDADFRRYENITYTNSLGFYNMNVGAPGLVYLFVNADEYFGEQGWNHEWYNIDENETVWANISVYPRPFENSTINGHITDNITGDPIECAEVELGWWDGNGHGYSNVTVTDSLGYYSMGIAAGNFRVYVYADGYWDFRSSMYNISDNEILWIDLAIEPLPPENCVVCGYITDVNTSKPIELVSITLNWEEYWGGRFWNRTYTGTSGFYKMNLPAGEFYLWFRAHGYLNEHSDHYNISENETIWLNISMYKRPPESSVVRGYITDEDSGEPIVDVRVELNWRDPYGHNWWDAVYTDASGYYSINTAAGDILVDLYHNRYSDNSTGWITIGENETLWTNFTLKLINEPPENPWITGPTYGKPGQEYNYTFNVYDENWDKTYCYIDWGDGNVTDWFGPGWWYDKGVVLNHTFSKKGTYYIRAKAKDVYGYESNWGTLKVNMPRNKILASPLFLKLLEHFPLLERLLSWFNLMK